MRIPALLLLFTQAALAGPTVDAMAAAPDAPPQDSVFLLRFTGG